MTSGLFQFTVMQYYVCHWCKIQQLGSLRVVTTSLLFSDSVTGCRWDSVST